MGTGKGQGRTVDRGEGLVVGGGGGALERGRAGRGPPNVPF